MNHEQIFDYFFSDGHWSFKRLKLDSPLISDLLWLESRIYIYIYINIGWILISSLIIYLFIFNQVSFDQHWGGIWDIWYVLMCLFLEKRPSFGINLPPNLLTRWKLNILSNCDPWELRCVCNFKKFLWQGLYNFPIASIYN